MRLINCQINLILTWPENCVIFSVTGKKKFTITGTNIMFQWKLYQLKTTQNCLNN